VHDLFVAKVFSKPFAITYFKSIDFKISRRLKVIHLNELHQAKSF
jgi:hypothetical protein